MNTRNPNFFARAQLAELSHSGLVSAATCLLKAAELVEKNSTIKIVGQPQYGQPSPGDKQFKTAIALNTHAVLKYRAAAGYFSAADHERGARAQIRAQNLAKQAEEQFEAGCKICTGG